MGKILLILKREYFTRVRNKTFWLSTLLLPIVMVAFIIGSAFLASSKKSELKKIALLDESGQFAQTLKSDSSKLIFTFIKKEDTAAYGKNGFDGLLYNQPANPKTFILKTPKTASFEFTNDVNRALNRAFESKQLQLSGIKKETLDSIKANSSSYYSVDNVTNDNKLSNGGIASGIGFISGILIYITMLIFGSMVMRGVMEEKTNRIAEVVVSSVKPFQLMMGKILGIGAAGLTQLLLWILIMMALSMLGAAFLPKDFMMEVAAAQQNNPMAGGQMMNISEGAKAFASLSNQNWPLILGCFIFYFVGGYLFYSSLFAAVGSVINEDPQEAQSLMLPIMMPIIFGFIILMNNLQTPDSKAMLWGSIIPFTSPIVMMGRIASGSYTVLELLASMVLLVGGFLFTTWLAGKIYRTGILMYGKKASWKEMMKWAFKKS